MFCESFGRNTVQLHKLIAYVKLASSAAKRVKHETEREELAQLYHEVQWSYYNFIASIYSHGYCTQKCVSLLWHWRLLSHRFLFGDQKTRLVLKWMMQWVKEKQRRGRDRKSPRLTRDGFCIHPAVLSRSSKYCTHRIRLPLNDWNCCSVTLQLNDIWCFDVIKSLMKSQIFLWNQNSTYLIGVVRKHHSITSAEMQNAYCQFTLTLTAESQLRSWKRITATEKDDRKHLSS